MCPDSRYIQTHIDRCPRLHAYAYTIRPEHTQTNHRHIETYCRHTNFHTSTHSCYVDTIDRVQSSAKHTKKVILLVRLSLSSANFFACGANIAPKCFQRLLQRGLFKQREQSLITEPAHILEARCIGLVAVEFTKDQVLPFWHACILLGFEIVAPFPRSHCIWVAKSVQ